MRQGTMSLFYSKNEYFNSKKQKFNYRAMNFKTNAPRFHFQFMLRGYTSIHSQVKGHQISTRYKLCHFSCAMKIEEVKFTGRTKDGRHIPN